MNHTKITILSLIALASLVLAFTHHWTFVIIAVVIIAINQREIMKR